MSQGEILTVFKAAFMIILKVGGPVLIISIVIGLVVSILQAATQVHEQTLTFVPKLLAIGLILLLTGSWMMNTIGDFTRYIFDLMASI